MLQIYRREPLGGVCSAVLLWGGAGSDFRQRWRRGGRGAGRGREGVGVQVT